MRRVMSLTRLGVVMVWAIVMVGAWGAFTFGDALGAGSATPSKVSALFQGNGNGHGNGGNGNGGGQGNGNGQGHNKDEADDEEVDAEAGGADFCGDVDAMIEYLEGKNTNGAAHANENGADNAAGGRLNKCMEHAPNGENAQGEGDTKGDVTVNVDVDDDGNGQIEYDLDGDCQVDFTEEVGEGPDDEGTPEASPEATPDGTPDAEEELMENCEVDDDDEVSGDEEDSDAEGDEVSDDEGSEDEDTDVGDDEDTEGEEEE
jgi:hypothetical protein